MSCSQLPAAVEPSAEFEASVKKFLLLNYKRDAILGADETTQIEELVARVPRAQGSVEDIGELCRACYIAHYATCLRNVNVPPDPKLSQSRSYVS